MEPIKTWIQSSMTATAVGAMIVLSAAPTAATTVSFTTPFDGVPIAESLPDHRYAAVSAYEPATTSRTTFEVELIDNVATIDLDPGIYNFSLLVASSPLDGRSSAAPGDLRATRPAVEVPAQGPLELEIPMQYAVHITNPFDNGEPWSGNTRSCPSGPQVDTRFTLAWESVPNVTTYQVRVTRRTCPDVFETETIPVSGTSVELTIDPETASTMAFTIVGITDRGVNVVTNPRMVYDDAQNETTEVHAIGEGSRLIRSTQSLFALQVARAAGVGSSFWTSDLTISNPSDSLATATLVFTPRGADGSIDYETATLDIPARATRTITDVLGNVFGLTAAAGSLELEPRSLQAWVRTATPADTGSYGQGYPMLAADDPSVLDLQGTRQLAAGGLVRGAARTNLTLAEIWGVDATVSVSLFDRDGVLLGSTSITLRPFENLQINDVVRNLTGTSSDLTEGRIEIEITAGGGRVAAALSIVDNGSDDPTTVVLEPFTN